MVTFDALQASLDIAEVAAQAGQPVESVAAVYFDVAQQLGLPWLREKITALPADRHWSVLAKGAMLDDLGALQRAITAAVVAAGADIADPSARVAAWQQDNRRTLERTAQLMGELRTVSTPEAAMLSVTLRELRSLG